MLRRIVLPVSLWVGCCLQLLSWSAVASSESEQALKLQQLAVRVEQIAVELNKPQRVDFSEPTLQPLMTKLADLQREIAALPVQTYSQANQIDYLLLRSRAHGLEFALKVSRPWARDPGFYVDQTLQLTFTDLPVTGEARERLLQQLAHVPELLRAARDNLTAMARDYAMLAEHNLGHADGVGHGHPYRELPPAGVVGWYYDLIQRAKQQQPELLPRIQEAQAAVKSYQTWLQQQLPELTAPAGVGKANYNWFLHHVKLMPYTVDELLVLGEREYQRLSSVLVLEQHRNRGLAQLTPAESEQEYARRIADADQQIRRFLDEQDIITVPADIGELDTNAPWIVRATGRNFWEEIQFRDPRPDHVHAVIPGHRFDAVMAERLAHTPIRQNAYDSVRVEGYATYLEEALMNAGLLDDYARTRELFYIFGMKRATRVHADIMMQLNQLSVAQAVDYMRERVPFLDRNVARVDAEIYLRQPPGYGLGYMIGKIQMDALLSDYAKVKGESFTLRGFHDAFLAAGRMPIALIRWELTGLDDEMETLWRVQPLNPPTSAAD